MMRGSQNGGPCGAFSGYCDRRFPESTVSVLSHSFPASWLRSRRRERSPRLSAECRAMFGAVKYFVAVVFAVVCLWLIGTIKLPGPGCEAQAGLERTLFRRKNRTRTARS